MELNQIVFRGINTTPWRVTRIEGEYVTAEIYGDPNTTYFSMPTTRHESYWLTQPYYITVHDSTLYPIVELLVDSELEVKQEILKILRRYDWKTLKYIRVNCDNFVTFEDGVIIQYTGTASSMIAMFEAIYIDAIEQSDSC